MDFLRMLQDRADADQLVLEPIPVTLPPRQSLPTDPTYDAVEADPRAYGVVVPDGSDPDEELALAVTRALDSALYMLNGYMPRLLRAIAPGFDGSLYKTRQTRACPACDPEMTSAALIYEVYPDGLLGRCIGGCSAAQIASAIARDVLANELTAQAEAQTDLASELARSCSLAAATGPYDAPQGWLIRGIIAADALTLIGGTAGDGKTWLAMGLAIAVASGTPWLGHRVVQGRTLLVLLEGSRTDRRRRIELLAHGLGTDLDELEGHLDVYPTTLRVDDPRSMGELTRHVQGRQYKFIVIDNLTEARDNADENSAAVMGAALRPLAELAHSHRAAVLLLHHTNAKGVLRGSTAIRQHPDVIFELTRTTPSNEALVTLSRAKDRFGGTVDEHRYRLIDSTGKVTPTIAERKQLPIATGFLVRDARADRLIHLLPATAEELYLGMVPTGRNTTLKLRTQLLYDKEIGRFGGRWYQLDKAGNKIEPVTS